MADYEAAAEGFIIEAVVIGIVAGAINFVLLSGGSLLLTALVSLLAALAVIFRLFANIETLIEWKLADDEMVEEEPSATDTADANAS